MWIALFLATCLLAAVTLLPLWRNPHWTVRGLDFPRLQIGVIAGLLLITELALLDLSELSTWLLAGVTLLCLLWQLWWIVPYTRLWPVEVTSADPADVGLSILTCNVLTSNRQAHLLIDLVRRYAPDILVTLESDAWWEAQLDVLQADMPHVMRCPLDNRYGMHVYSRLPLSEQEISFLVEDDIPSMHALVTLPNGARLRMHFLHPAPPSPTENPESAERDAELVIVARSIAKSNQPIIVTGDLNDVAWSPTTRLFRKVSGLLDPRVGRGMFNTFHADYPVLRWPLDHLFHSSHFTVCRIERLPSMGSDHFPLFTELAFTPRQGADQEGLKADEDDHREADEMAEDQEVEADDVPRPGSWRAHPEFPPPGWKLIRLL